MKQAGFKVSRATVYRTLGKLVDAGLLRKLEVGPRKCYEHDYGYPAARASAVHQCRKMIEFQSPALEAVLREVCPRASLQRQRPHADHPRHLRRVQPRPYQQADARPGLTSAVRFLNRCGRGWDVWPVIACQRPKPRWRQGWLACLGRRTGASLRRETMTVGAPSPGHPTPKNRPAPLRPRHPVVLRPSSFLRCGDRRAPRNGGVGRPPRASRTGTRPSLAGRCG